MGKTQLMRSSALIALFFFATGASALTTTSTINGVTWRGTDGYSFVYTEYSDTSCSTAKTATEFGLTPHPITGTGLGCNELTYANGNKVYFKAFCDSTYGGFI